MRFEVIKEGKRVPRWRLRDASGAIVPLAPGKVHLPPTTQENRRVREAVDAVLNKLASEHNISVDGQ